MKKIAARIVIFQLVVGLTCCTADTEQVVSETGGDTSGQEDETEEKALTDDEEQQNYAKNYATAENGPYFSLTYVKLKPSEQRIIYSYDINTKQLQEECALPLNVYKNDLAVFSRDNNTVYYSGLADPKHYAEGDSLWAYNIETGETLKLDDENRVNFGFTVLDSGTLLVSALTDEGAVVPALFDLESRTYTYMSDSDDNLHYITSLIAPPYYNDKTKRFVCIYCDHDEYISDDYQDGKTEMTRYIALTSSDLTVDEDKIFAHTAKISELSVAEAIQISENELLLSMRKGNDYGFQREYYSLVFEDGEAVLTKVACPYPYADYVSNLCTVDGGKTLFFYLSKNDELGNTPGVYSYCTETDELTPILLNDPEKDNSGMIHFTIVGPGETHETKEESQSSTDTEYQQPGITYELIKTRKEYMTLEKITVLGYYPTWMQPYTVIVYDSEGNPTITEGGELTPEEVEVSEDIATIGFLQMSSTVEIKPDTKVEYDLHGFLQNIYYLVPGTESEYQLAPPGY